LRYKQSSQAPQVARPFYWNKVRGIDPMLSSGEVEYDARYDESYTTLEGRSTIESRESLGCKTNREFLDLVHQQFRDLSELKVALSGVLDVELIEAVHRFRHAPLLPFFNDITTNGSLYEAAARQWAGDNGLLDGNISITPEIAAGLTKFTWEGSKYNPKFEAYYEGKKEEAQNSIVRLEDQMELHKGAHSLNALAHRDLRGDQNAYAIAIKREDSLPISLKDKFLYEPIEKLAMLIKGLRWDDYTIFSPDVGDDLLIKKRLRSIAEASYTIR
jgi:hypothetical protein